MLGSLSKTYAMTGWRAGFALGPKPIISAMSKLQSQSTSSTAAMVQKAAIAALNGSQECVCEMRADYIRLRDTVVAGLKEIPGFTCTMPEGAFYAYPNVAGLLKQTGIATPAELATRLLHDAGVCRGPGRALWHTRTHPHLLRRLASGCGGGSGANPRLRRKALNGKLREQRKSPPAFLAGSSFARPIDQRPRPRPMRVREMISGRKAIASATSSQPRCSCVIVCAQPETGALLPCTLAEKTTWETM